MKNLHLFISVLIVIPAALVYGFQPNLLFDVNLDTIDEANILKAIMGLYLAFATLWIVGILNPSLWKVATVSNIIFMLGLGFGRIISMLFDGFPSSVFIIGTIGEMILGFYGCYILQREKEM
jgi:uncharacterized membrane protein